MADAYTFTGFVTTGYPDYRDLATERMLVADPGESYGIAAINGAAPVPPADGRWSPPYVPPVPVPEPGGGGEPAGEPAGEQGGAPPGEPPSPSPVPSVPSEPPAEGGEQA